MKRTPLKRKTPLKPKTALKSKTSLKRKTPIKSCGQSASGSKPKAKSRGLTGHGRSASDKAWHSQVASLGCFACNHLGIFSSHCLRIHHPNGRNKGKEGDCCEAYVICLCDCHHDPSILIETYDGPSVHGNKRLFRELVGSEAWCVYETHRALNVRPKWLEDDVWADYLLLGSQAEQEEWIVELEKFSHRMRAIA